MAVALVVAAGRGERLGSGGPKAFVMPAGRPMIDWSLEALHSADDVRQIVVALPAGVTAPAGTLGVRGGEQRSQSVRAALRAAGGREEVVLVHDAARPLVTARTVRDCLDVLAREDCDGAIAAAPLADTVKETRGDQVVRTLDRSRLWAVQTPQVFRRAALEHALGRPDAALAAATDDASLVEAAGGSVRLVEAPVGNFKVTTEADLARAAAALC
jgi:2-C-methyl-D-erythritol 4-phosphate cytidylyltransferase